LNTILKHIKKFPELLVLSFLFIFRIVYFFSLTYTLTPDSYEYIAVDGFAWLQGSVDRYRLPVYSMLIDICQFISKNHFVIKQPTSISHLLCQKYKVSFFAILCNCKILKIFPITSNNPKIFYIKIC